MPVNLFKAGIGIARRPRKKNTNVLKERTRAGVPAAIASGIFNYQGMAAFWNARRAQGANGLTYTGQYD